MKEIDNSNDLAFTSPVVHSNYSIFNYMLTSASSDNSFDLISQIPSILEVMPRNFTITTNNGSYKFNTELLKNMSSVISDMIKQNPKNLEYHIDLNEESDAMPKLEQLFLGKTAFFEEKDIPQICEITSALNIIRCPNYMRKEDNKNLFDPFWFFKESGATFSTSNLSRFFKNKASKAFTITTKSKKYLCNNFGVLTSRVISDKVALEPTTDHFDYDFNDEFGEFNDIYKLFNFDSIKITTNNMDLLRKIATELDITSLLEKLDTYFEKYENSLQTINDKQIFIDEIDEIFEWLYGLKKITAESVKDKILKSNWVKSSSSVKELAACFLQVINTDFSYHSLLIELLVQLNQEANNKNNLHILIPFISKKLLNSFAQTKLNCSFVYLMIKNGFISIETVINLIMKNDIDLQDQKNNNNNISFESNEMFDQNEHSHAVLWFFPELIELKKINIHKLFSNVYAPYQMFMKEYYPNKIEDFKKMRDNDELSDGISNSLRKDDVDRLQKIISMKGINIDKSTIAFNIFEDITDDQLSLIDYSALNGSINCFKYLLLNHASLSNRSYHCAVFGGNNEIIRTITQTSNNDINGKNALSIHLNIESVNQIDKFHSPLIPKANNFYFKMNPIFITIKKHQNDLFEWIIQSEIPSKSNEDLINLVIYSLKNGNAHSLAECVNQGFDITSLQMKQILELISLSSILGYFKLTQLIIYLTKELFENPDANKKMMISKLSEYKGIRLNSDKMTDYSYFGFYESSIIFGNLSIFRLIIEMVNKPNETQITNCFLLAIKEDYFDIIEFILKDLDFKPSNSIMNQSLVLTIETKTDDLFLYLLDYYKIVPDGSVLLSACSNGNIKISKILTDLILNDNPKFDFSEAFIQAGLFGSEEICQYFVDKNASFKFYKLEENAPKFISVNENIFFLLTKIAEPESKEIILNSSLKKAIKNTKKEVVKYLLNENVELNDALFEAISANDIEIFDMILKHNSDPLFINQIIEEKGTALIHAVELDKDQFVERLLALPGINPSLYNKNIETPLIIAVTSLNCEIVFKILDFYGDKIQDEIWQVNKSIEMILLRSKVSYLDDLLFNQISYYELLILNHLIHIENVDLNIRVFRYTLFSYVCENNLIDIVKFLLDNEKVDVNSYAIKSGHTALTNSILNKEYDIVKLLIESPRVDINVLDFDSLSPLNIAVLQKEKGIVELLVNSEKFDPVKSQIDLSFYESNDNEILQILSKIKELNVNFSVFHSSLSKAVNDNNETKIDLILSHPSFDQIKSQLKSIIFNQCAKFTVPIFKKLISYMNNKMLIYDGNSNSSLFSSLANNKNWLIMQEVFENSDDYDLNGIDMLELFVMMLQTSFTHAQQTIDQFFNILDLIVEYDRKHDNSIHFDRLLPSGSSFFTSLYPSFFVNRIVAYLLDHGVDPNMPDEFGVYPLENAIRRDSFLFVQALCASEDIDFSVRLGEKKRSYVHITAESSGEAIFNIVLFNDQEDLNYADLDGETPLILAVKKFNFQLAANMIRRNDIDYLHVNNKGESAVSVFLRRGSKNGQFSLTDDYLKSITKEMFISMLIKKKST